MIYTDTTYCALSTYTVPAVIVGQVVAVQNSVIAP
jgi:hypothetical protein